MFFPGIQTLSFPVMENSEELDRRMIVVHRRLSFCDFVLIPYIIQYGGDILSREVATYSNLLEIFSLA